MNIRFTDEDWNRIERDWSLFWEGKLKRPIVWVDCYDLSCKPVDEKCPYVPQYPSQMSAEEIIEIETRHLETMEFVGDTFPKFFLNFGPGSSAAYFGSNLRVGQYTTWFEPIGKELKDISFNIDKYSCWYKRVHVILDAALKKWQGLVQVCFSDIGGNLDIIASLRGTNQLLLDLCDHGDVLEQLLNNLTKAWIKIYSEEADKIRAVCRGTTAWAPVWSKRKTYMLQSDFSYMISPKMFSRFVLPDLTRCCEFLDDTFYHLDGKGQLAHLDMLLSIEKLKGIQWIPGDGQPGPEEWLSVLKKIRDAGKLCQVYVPPEGALKIKNELGGKGFIFAIDVTTKALTAGEARKLYSELTEEKAS